MCRRSCNYAEGVVEGDCFAGGLTLACVGMRSALPIDVQFVALRVVVALAVDSPPLLGHLG